MMLLMGREIGRRGLGLGYSPPPANIQTVLQNASNSSGVPLNILQAVAFQESSYNPNAVSSAGAQGLMQLMPATAKSLGVSNSFDPQQNADAGASYLASLYKQYGDWNTALIAYNEGPGNLQNQGPFQSSQNYASSILANAGEPPTLGPFVGPPDVFGSSVTADTSTISGSSDSSSSSMSPLVPVGLGLGLLGVILLAR